MSDGDPTARSAPSPVLAQVPWKAVAVFTVAALGLGWLVSLPLYLRDPTDPGYTTLFSTVALAMMFTPAVATLIALFVMRTPRTGKMRFFGFWPLRPAKRVVWFTVAMFLIPALLVGASVAVAAAFGWIQLDLTNFSGFREFIETQPGAAAADALPIETVAIIQIIAIPAIGVLNVLTLAILGEEIAWRGWLLPALRPLGVWPALLLSGVIWGVWHAPLILLGYNFNRTDIWGVLLMTAGCVIWGVLFGWLRLRTGSLWPAVAAHATFNAAGSTLLTTVPQAGADMNMALVNPLGVSGWIVVTIVVVALALAGQFRRERQLAAKGAKAVKGAQLPQDANGPQSAQDLQSAQQSAGTRAG